MMLTPIVVSTSTVKSSGTTDVSQMTPEKANKLAAIFQGFNGAKNVGDSIYPKTEAEYRSLVEGTKVVRNVLNSVVAHSGHPRCVPGTMMPDTGMAHRMEVAKRSIDQLGNTSAARAQVTNLLHVGNRRDIAELALHKYAAHANPGEMLFLMCDPEKINYWVEARHGSKPSSRDVILDPSRLMDAVPRKLYAPAQKSEQAVEVQRFVPKTASSNFSTALINAGRVVGSNLNEIPRPIAGVIPRHR
jgi:hypothetical protein